MPNGRLAILSLTSCIFILGAVPARAAIGINTTRRAFLKGLASTAALPNFPCADLLVAAVSDPVPTVPGVRSGTFAYILRFWPYWMKSDPATNAYFPKWATLSVHADPAIMRVEPEVRAERMTNYLLENETRIEKGLSGLPARIAARTGLPLEVAKNLTGHFLGTIQSDNNSLIYTMMTYHRQFFLAAVEEISAIEPDLAIMPRMAVEHYFAHLNPATASRLDINLEEGSQFLREIEGRVMMQTPNTRLVYEMANDMYRALRVSIPRAALSKRVKTFMDRVMARVDFTRKPDVITLGPEDSAPMNFKDFLEKTWNEILAEPEEEANPREAFPSEPDGNTERDP